MRLRELVVGEVLVPEARLGETLEDNVLVLRRARLEAHEDARRIPAYPVGELRDVARVDVPVQLDEGTRPLGDLHRDERLRGVGALRDEAEPIEVHVCAARDGHHGLARELMLLGILHHAGDREGARRLEDHARVDEAELDGATYLVRGHSHHLIQRHLAQPEGLVSDLPNSSAVCEEAHRRQLNDFARFQGVVHPRGIGRLNANDLDVGPHRLEEHANARGEATSPDAAKHVLDVLLRRLR
mmetsp:Transcript_23050/g.64885  ORF Transcript_23050/g.64885 Transcript_23050/m.64885 type:complete len:242 (-) Transcript_23050:777-1502(-)